MKRIYLGVLGIIFLVPLYSKAQDVNRDTIVWESSHAVNWVTGEKIDLPTTFITYGERSIEWIQENVNKKKSFNISNVSGQWGNATQDGQLTYVLSVEGKTARIEFARKSGLTLIKCSIIHEGVQQMPFEFEVNNVTKKKD